MTRAKSDDQLSPEATARRRDEVIKRMLNTPPKPHAKKAEKTEAKAVPKPDQRPKP